MPSTSGCSTNHGSYPMDSRVAQTMAADQGAETSEWEWPAAAPDQFDG